MSPKQGSSFFLYDMGIDPSLLSLGSLVLCDYANPTKVPRYIHPPLSEEERESLVSSIQIDDCLIHKRSGGKFAMGIDVISIFHPNLSWGARNEMILAAKTGVRSELKDAQDFLTTHVAQPHGKAENTLKIWLSAACSKDILARFKTTFRPKIWMVTGLYLLEDVRIVGATNKSASPSAGIDALKVGALSGIPVGGSISVSPDKSLKVEFATKQRLVWAAQFQRLDVRYWKVEAGEKEPTLPCTLRLYPDIFSVGSVVRHSSTESQFASLRLLDEEGSSGNVEIAEDDLEYLPALREAIEELEEFLT